MGLFRLVFIASRQRLVPSIKRYIIEDEQESYFTSYESYLTGVLEGSILKARARD